MLVLRYFNILKRDTGGYIKQPAVLGVSLLETDEREINLLQSNGTRKKKPICETRVCPAAT